MINWKLISTLLAQEFYTSPGNGKYNVEFLVRSWKAHFEFKPGSHYDTSTMDGNYAIFYNFFMTLANQEAKSDLEKVTDILNLLKTIRGGFNHEFVKDIFARGGYTDEIEIDFTSKYLTQYGKFHKEIIKHSGKLFEQGNFFHAVHEACKAYNNKIKELTQSGRDGVALMQFEFGSGGSIKINAGQTDSEKNEQNGIKSLSEGLMSAFRNPTAHETALDWNVTKEDCLDILSLVSFLFKKLDKIN